MHCILCPGLLSPLKNDLVGSVEETLQRFLHATKLGDVNTLNKREEIQKEQDRLEQRVEAKRMEFDREKCQDRENARHKKMGEAWLGSRIHGRDLGVLVNHKLSMCQQCDTAAKNAKAILGCINHSTESRSQEVIVPLGSAHLEYCIQDSLKKRQL